MTKREQAERAEAIEKLREWIKPGDTVYTALVHVSRSGMSREIRVSFVVDGSIENLTGYVARACGYRLKRGWQDSIVVGGCGMDMGFHLVYELSHALFPQGFDCIGDRCPSNDHSNRENNSHHRDGGYALRQRWL